MCHQYIICLLSKKKMKHFGQFVHVFIEWALREEKMIYKCFNIIYIPLLQNVGN